MATVTENKGAFCVQWQDADQKGRGRTFSIRKYGRCEAFRLAQETLNKVLLEKEEILKERHPFGKGYANRFYDLHRKMIDRCYNPKTKAYKNYGAIGVTVCDRWRFGEGGFNGLHCFTEDMQEGYREGLSVNRIGNALVYSKETCEWSTDSMQGFDKRRLKGNSSGRTGIHIIKRMRTDLSFTVRYRAIITVGGEHIQIGNFKTFEEAVKAREEAELKYFGRIKNPYQEDYYED
jgi:hypothetical protein